jgi:hypothetical protein
VGSVDAVSRIQIGDVADAAGRKRFEALIATSDQAGTVLAEIRLAGFVANDGSGVSRISGLFRADSGGIGLLLTAALVTAHDPIPCAFAFDGGSADGTGSNSFQQSVWSGSSTSSRSQYLMPTGFP